MNAAYGDTVAATWEVEAGLVYGPLTAALVATLPTELGRGIVLDAGSGVGAVAAVVARSGATVVASDLSSSMIAAQLDRSWPAAVADVLALPFRGNAFDAAVAAFLLNHLDPEAALLGMRRVVRPGGVVVASTWLQRRDPVKSAIDAVLGAHGWEPPAWYGTMKTVIEPVSGDPDRLSAAAERAGLVDVVASVHAEPLDLRDAPAVVGYRFATPHIAPWVAALDATTRNRLADAAASAVEPCLVGWRPAAIFLSARVPGQPRRHDSAAGSDPSR